MSITHISEHDYQSTAQDSSIASASNDPQMCSHHLSSATVSLEHHSPTLEHTPDTLGRQQDEYENSYQEMCSTDSHEPSRQSPDNSDTQHHTSLTDSPSVTVSAEYFLI